MSLNSRLSQLGVLAGMLVAAPLFAQSIAVTCPNAGPGADITCTVSLTLGSATINSLNVNVLITPQGSAPDLAQTGTSSGVSWDGSSVVDTLKGTAVAPLGNNDYHSVGELFNVTKTGDNLAGFPTVGTFDWFVPTTAVANQTYSVAFTSATVAQQGTTPVPLTATNAVVTVVGVLTFSSPAAGALTPQASVGVAYSQTFVAAGGTAPYTWTITTGALPAGLNLNASTGVVSGTPTTANTAGVPFSLTATDSATPTKATVSRAFTLVVNGAITGVNPTGLPAGTVNAAYTSGAISVTGGLSPYTFTTTANLASYGLALAAGPAATTTITGTPTTAAAPLSIPLKVTDSNNAVFNATLTITINGPLSLSPASGTLPPATVGFAYATTTIAGAGGTAPYTYSAGTAGVLPGGLTVGSTGQISGTPTTAGTFSNVQVTVKDSASGSVTNTYTIVVNPTLTLTAPASLPNDTATVAYPAPSSPFSVTGGSGTYSWAITGLPGVSNTGTGASFTPTGTPTTPGTYTVVVTVTDTGAGVTGVSASKTYTSTTAVVIAPGVQITGSTTSAIVLATATVGKTYGPSGAGISIPTTGGTANYTWSVTPGTLPAGLNITGTGTGGATGLISGTPTGPAGPSTFTAKVVDAAGSSATQQYTITVYAAPALTGPASLPLATAGTAFTTALTTYTLTGGAPTVVWSATGLPTGLTINAGTGLITGTPAAGTDTGSPYSVVVKVIDGNGATATAPAASLIVHPIITITPGALSVAIPSVAYKVTTFTAGGGSGSGYTFTATGLPTGLTLTSAGVLSGTTTAAANTYPVVVTVTDGSGATHAFSLPLAVAPPLSISGPATLPGGTVNVAYVSTTVTATGGTTPYVWTATNLPPGLTINSASGAVSGIPTAVAGSPYAVVVTVTDANKTTATMNYSIAIGALPLKIITGLLPTGVVNAPYPFTSINAQGGVGNYSWTITGLPAGLTTDGSGNISGTPTTTTGSPFTVVVTVTDATQTSISRTFSLAISGLLTVTAPTTLPAASLNTAYVPVTAIAGGGLPPYTWAATGLPTGMSIAIATGIISGTPTTAAGSPYSVTVTVTDSTGKTASQTYTLAVNAPLTITGPASLPNGTVGTAYTSTTVTAQGGSGVYTWSATGLPSGLSIAGATGAITGTPAASAVGTASVVVTVTDSSSATATKSYSLTVNPGVSTVPVIASVSASTEGQTLIAPNTWVSIYGSNFATAGFTDTWTHAISTSSTGALPTTLDGVSVMVGGQAAYVAYLSASQINVLTPNVGFGPLQVTVANAAGTSNAVTITSQQDVPGFFEWPSGCTSNCQPVATHADYSDAVANGTFAGVTTVPAAPGETIVLWGSGFGTTTPAIPYGVAVPSTPVFDTTAAVSATLNGAPVTVYQGLAFLTAGNAGLFQMGLTVPAGLANGSYPLIVTINSIPSPALMLTVHN